MEIRRLSSLVRAVAEGHQAIAVFLHGSHAAGAAREDSDVDLAVLLPPGHDFESAAAALAEAVAEEFRVSPDDVDVQNLRGAPPLFRVRATCEGLPLYVGDSATLARFQGASLSEHWDTEYFLEPFRAAMRERIRQGRYAT